MWKFLGLGALSCLRVAAGEFALEEVLSGEWSMRALVVEWGVDTESTESMYEPIVHEWRLQKDTSEASASAEDSEVLIGKWTMRDSNTNTTLEQMHVRISMDDAMNGKGHVDVGTDIYDLKLLFDFAFDLPSAGAPQADDWKSAVRLAHGVMSGNSQLEIPAGHYQWAINSEASTFTLSISRRCAEAKTTKKKKSEKAAEHKCANDDTMLVLAAKRRSDSSAASSGWFGKNVSTFMLLALVLVNFFARNFMTPKTQGAAKAKSS